MKRICLLCCLLMAFSASGLHAQMRILPRSTVDSLARAYSGPREWSIEEMLFDSLRVRKPATYEDAEPIKASFRFRNKSSESLVIKRLETSCSCVDAVMEQRVIAPGDYALIDVTYRQKGHPGVHDRYIFLYTEKDGEDSPCAILALSTLVLTRE